MGAMTNPTDNPAAIIRALLALAERAATTHSRDPEGSHFAGWNVMSDPRGVCVLHFRDLADGEIVKDGTGFRMVGRTRVGECAPRCREWRQAVEAARAWLARQEVRQLPLEEVA